MLTLSKEYAAFVAEEDDMQDVDAKTSLMYVKRFVHVASYLPLAPPIDSSGCLLGMKHKAMMSLLFARDGKYEWSQGYDLIVGTLSKS